MLQKLYKDDFGAVLSAELVVVMTMLVIGMITGLGAIQSAITWEMDDVSSAIGKLNQTYSFHGFSKNCATVTGSKFDDRLDTCDPAACNGNDISLVGALLETP